MVLFLLLIVNPQIAIADFNVEFKNDFNKKIYYTFYWIDHPYDWLYPTNMAGGEIEANASYDLKVKWLAGKYYVVWRDGGDWRNEFIIIVSKKICKVVIATRIEACNWLAKCE